MMTDTWTGLYDYKGFAIWSPSEKLWIAEPNFKSDVAIDNFKGSIFCVTHPTIAKAKKWVREVGIELKEEDFMDYSVVKAWTKENNPYK